MSNLSPSSYIVLGFIQRFGAMTSYDLKQWADGSVGYFWNFSRAQLYKEPARLKKLQLLRESQESSGRRRRLYEITEEGKYALNVWLKGPSAALTELRDIGLLKLYFADLIEGKDLCRLAQEQIGHRRERLKEYQSIQMNLEQDPDWQHFLDTVEMGIRYETTAMEFWQHILDREMRAASK